MFNFGDALMYGDVVSLGLDVNDVIGIAATAPPLPPELIPFAKAGAFGLGPGSGRPISGRGATTTSIAGGGRVAGQALLAAG